MSATSPRVGVGVGMSTGRVARRGRWPRPRRRAARARGRAARRAPGAPRGAGRWPRTAAPAGPRARGCRSNALAALPGERPIP